MRDRAVSRMFAELEFERDTALAKSRVAEDKYDAALTVLAALQVRQPHRDDQGLCVGRGDVLYGLGPLALAAWRRISADVPE